MNNNSYGLLRNRLSNFLLSTAWAKGSQLWRQTFNFPAPALAPTVELFNGGSGGGGGGNPLNTITDIAYTPAVGDLLLVLATYALNVNQFFQPGDTIPEQLINLNIFDNIPNNYTRIAYQEQFPPYIANGIGAAVATGIWACIASNTLAITQFTSQANTLHDTSLSTGFTPEYSSSLWFYALRPGRMPVKVADFYRLTQNVATPKFASNAGRLCICNVVQNDGISSSNFGLVNTETLQHQSVQREAIPFDAVGGAGSFPMWQGSVVRI